MAIAQASVAVSPGQQYTVPVGTTATVGAVVIANESPYALRVSNGSSTQWIVAQTADIVLCNSMGFSGTLIISTDNYLTNADSAPSFLIYLTTFAPGETIPGQYPAPLMRLANGAIGVATQLVNDGNPAGSRIIEATPGAEPQSYIIVNNDGTFNVFYKSPTLGIVQSFISGLTPDAQYGVGFQVSNGLAVFGPTKLDAGAADPIITDGNGNLTQVGNVTSRGIVTAKAPVALAAGNQLTGHVDLSGNLAAAAFLGYGCSFPVVMTNMPTSITLVVGTSANINTVSVPQLSKDNFFFQIQATAAAYTAWHGTYTTVGNCLLAVDAQERTFDHHCDVCGHVSIAVPFTAIAQGNESEQSMSYACPSCGAIEAFNGALSATDEADTTPQGSGDYATTRGAQATLIRQLMTALALPIMA